MLLEELKKMKEELAARDKEEAEVEESAEEISAEAAEEEKEAAEEPEEPTAKEEEKEEGAKEEETADASTYQRLRREAAANKKLAEELKARLAELQSKPEIEPEKEGEALVIPSDPEIEAIKEERRYKLAEEEFRGIESAFKAKVPDYEAVSAEYGMALAQSLRLQNPAWSNQRIFDETNKTIIKKAAQFQVQGFNPVEELYYEAKTLGFTGQSMKKKEEKESDEEDISPDMKKLKRNRERSSGMTATGGQSQGQMTLAHAATLSPSEWKKLPAAEKQRLLRSGAA